MLFSNPIMLWGILLVAVPLMIHLFFKKQQQVELWGAMQFLERVMKQQRRRLQLQSWLRPLVQMLMLACVVLAAANPVPLLEAESVDKVSQHHLIVLDQSMSTNAFDGEVTTFSREQLYVEELIKHAAIGDSFQVLVNGSNTPRYIDRPTYDHQTVLKEVQNLRPGYLVGDLIETLKLAKTMLEQVDDDILTSVHLLSDLQYREWKTGTREQAQLTRQIELLDRKVRLKIIDVGNSQVANAAIVELSLSNSRVSIGEQVEVDVVVQNYATEPASITLNLMLDGVSQEMQPIFIKEKDVAHVAFTSQFSKPGLHLVEVVSATDGLLADNYHWQIVDVVDQLEVLIVEELQNDAATKRTASDYLKLAFSPEIRTTIGNVSSLTPEVSQKYDIVFVTNIAALTSSEAEILERFVDQGGGLVVALGPAVSPENYNSEWNSDNRQLLPALLLDEVAIAGERPFLFTPRDPGHPVIKQFAGHPDAGLESTRIYRYHKVTPNETADRIIDTNTGDSILLMHQHGQGRVALITTAIDEVWGSWVAWPSFVPVMNELMRYVSAGNRNVIHTKVSEPFPVFSEAETRWVGPLKKMSDMTTSTTFSPEEPGGFFGQEVRTNRIHTVLRQVDVRESDLSRIEKARLAEVYFDNDLSVFESTLASTANTRNQDRSPSQLTMLFLVCAGLFFLIDQCLSWNFNVAVSLLIGTILGVLVCLSLPVSKELTVVTAVIFGGASYWLMARKDVSSRV